MWAIKRSSVSILLAALLALLASPFAWGSARASGAVRFPAAAKAQPAFVRAKAQPAFVQATVTPQLGSARVAIDLRAVPDLRFSVKLNGHDVTSQFPSRLGLRRVTLLGADDGLRPGRNVLIVRAARSAGASGSATASFTVSNQAPLVAAGPDVTVLAGEHVQLHGEIQNLPAGRGRLPSSWRIMLAPAGSRARIRAPHSLTAEFTPDRPGTYRLRLEVPTNEGTAYDELTVVDQANYPPIGAPISTMTGRYGWTIQVGTFSHTFNPYPGCLALNVALVDRYTLAVPYAHTLGGGVNSANALLSEIKTLINNGQLNAHPLVIISAPGQNPNINCTTVDSAWNNVLTKIGAQALPSYPQVNGGWSVVGVYDGAAGTAWVNNGTNEPDDLTAGAINGYLQNDYVGPFAFVPAQRIPVDLSAPGAAAGQNIIEVGTTTYQSGALPCGSGGFQVVVLNAVTLAQLSTKTVATNGCGTSTDIANQQALIQYLQGVAASPAVNVPQALVLIQSIGTPYDPNATATWQQLDTAVAGVGGTPTVLANDTSSYSLLGSVGITAFPLAEGSGTATPKSPAHVTGVLKRVPSYVYQPDLSAATGNFGFGLATLAYQPSQSFSDTAGERAALNYISGPSVLNLPAPVAGSSDFCYAPPSGQLDVRYAYCDKSLRNRWTAQYTTDVQKAPYKAGLGFTPQDLSAVQQQLAPVTGTGEFDEVSSVWTDIDDLKNALNTESGPAFGIAFSAATNIEQALQSRTSGDVAGKWFDVIANSLNAIGALYVNDPEIAEPVNVIAAGLYLAEDGVGGDGEPALGNFSVSVSNFLSSMQNAYQAAESALNHVLGIIVTDPGKLSSFYQNSSNYDYNSTVESDQALDLGAAAFAWQSLLPSAYELVQLSRGDYNHGVTNARSYTCSYQVIRIGPRTYAPFPDAPDSGQLLNSHLYVLVEKGAMLPDGQDEYQPPTPPASLTDPLFAPFQANNNVITQFGLYQPWFYRQAYPAANRKLLQGCNR